MQKKSTKNKLADAVAKAIEAGEFDLAKRLLEIEGGSPQERPKSRHEEEEQGRGRGKIFCANWKPPTQPPKFLGPGEKTEFDNERHEPAPRRREPAQAKEFTCVDCGQRDLLYSSQSSFYDENIYQCNRCIVKRSRGR